MHEKPTNLHRPIDCADAVRSIAEFVDLDLVEGAYSFSFGTLGAKSTKLN